MSILLIFRTLRHFYFNYHHPESISLWIQSAFMRRIQFGIREMICFLIVGFLSYKTQLSNQLLLEYLVPIISILCLQQTFGSTLSCCCQITLAITPLSIFLYIAQKIGLGYHDYLATELLLLFTSFCIAYGCFQFQTKKISLLYNVLYFGSNFSQPAITSTFSFELLVVYLIGMITALIVSLLIFPFFATFDIENRFNYSLSKLQQMHGLIIQAFLSHDKMSAQMFLAKAAIIENLIQKAIISMQMRLDEARFEPSRYLQRIFNRKHRHIIDLTLQSDFTRLKHDLSFASFVFLEQENLIISLMFHICSLPSMVKQCTFNDSHHDFTGELRSSLLHLSSCQLIVASSLIAPSSVTKDEFNHRIMNLQDALKTLRSAYIAARVHHIKQAVESSTKIQLEDHLSHTFFLFQLNNIVRLLTQDMTSNNCEEKKPKKQQEEQDITVKQQFILQWPRLLSSLKCMIIIGVGSIFVLVPRLAKAFENGQWILVTLCMTQGDTVGGAFIAMKMRLIGTLLGAIWAYITYLSVGDNVYQTLGMLSPWLFLFGYLKLVPSWGYTATVAAFTPVLINLGRLPFGDQLPAGDFALLRIEESVIGITIAVVLTLLIFPTFAIDLLKDSTQTTLKTCQQSILSMHSIYDQLFHHQHSRESLIHLEFEEKTIKSFINSQRCHFHQLIAVQRTLVEHASLEPTLWWVNNAFSTKRYNELVQQQINTFRILHNIDSILMKINEYSANIEHLQLNAAGGNFLPNVHKEISDLSRQLNDCLCLWISYFSITQTRFYRLFRQCIYSRRKLIETDFLKHRQCLVDLHQTIYRLQTQHQEGLNRLLEHYLHRLSEGDSYANIIPYINNDEADAMFISYHAMFYSTTQLAQTVLTLGETIHTILEVETTQIYRPF